MHDHQLLENQNELLRQRLKSYGDAGEAEVLQDYESSGEQKLLLIFWSNGSIKCLQDHLIGHLDGRIM